MHAGAKLYLLLKCSGSPLIYQQDSTLQRNLKAHTGHITLHIWFVQSFIKSLKYIDNKKHTSSKFATYLIKLDVSIVAEKPTHIYCHNRDF